MDACIAQSVRTEFEKAQHTDPLCSQVIKYALAGRANPKSVTQLYLSGKPVVTYTTWQSPSPCHPHCHPCLEATGDPLKDPLGTPRDPECRQHAKMSVWWPGVSRQIEEFVRNCPHCERTTDAFYSSVLFMAKDWFLLNGKTSHCYFSRYPEVVTLLHQLPHRV